MRRLQTMTTKIGLFAAVLVASLLLTVCGSPAPVDEPANGNPLLIDVAGVVASVARFSPDEADELESALRQDPLVYFRMINTEWAGAVCDSFTDQFSRMPVVNLQGDAHIEQFALTSTERGLDDFDDAVSGPAVLDMVRFLGSVELTIRRRGWESDRDQLFQTFFDGYRQGLEDTSYIPATPAIVHRLREEETRTKEEFLEWAEALMEPLPPELMTHAEKSMAKLNDLYHKDRPDLSLHYFDLKSAGLLRLGVGSALTPKALSRIEGETADPLDDLIVEAKELSDIGSIGCVTLPATGEVYRVISGNDRVGRLTHEIVAVAPRDDDEPLYIREFWLRSWEPSYREITVDEYRSADELSEVVHDAGAQLGAGAIMRDERKTQAQISLNNELQPRISQTAIAMTDQLIEAWEIVSPTIAVLQ